MDGSKIAYVSGFDKLARLSIIKLDDTKGIEVPMTDFSVFTSVKPLSAIALLATGSAVTAAPIQIEVGSSYEAAPSQPVTEVIDSGLPDAEVWHSFSNGLVNLTGSAYADQSGDFDATASGTRGTFNVESFVSYTTSVVNDSNQARRVAFDFTVESGELSIYEPGYARLGSVTTAGYDARIQVGGAERWASSASLSVPAQLGEADFAETGRSLDGELDLTFWSNGITNEENPDPQGGRARYVWDDQEHSVDLGVLDAGQSLELTYVVRVVTSGLKTYLQDLSGYGGDAIARFGDPFSFSGDELFDSESFRFTSVASVPEPASGLLFGAGLMALGWARRRYRGE